MCNARGHIIRKTREEREGGDGGTEVRNVSKHERRHEGGREAEVTEIKGR